MLLAVTQKLPHDCIVWFSNYHTTQSCSSIQMLRHMTKHFVEFKLSITNLKNKLYSTAIGFCNININFYIPISDLKIISYF
jgi:hypothetical protein